MLVATAHGTVLNDVLRNPDLARLVGGAQPVILGDDAARRAGGAMKKTRLERAGAAVFPLLVELDGRARWRVHYAVEASVDALLEGRPADAHVREWDGNAGGAGGAAPPPHPRVLVEFETPGGAALALAAAAEAANAAPGGARHARGRGRPHAWAAGGALDGAGAGAGGAGWLLDAVQRMGAAAAGLL
jgi:hypothetical protein